MYISSLFSCRGGRGNRGRGGRRRGRRRRSGGGGGGCGGGGSDGCSGCGRIIAGRGGPGCVMLGVPVLHQQLVDLLGHLARPVEPLDVHLQRVTLRHLELLDLTDVEGLVGPALDVHRVPEFVL